MLTRRFERVLVLAGLTLALVGAAGLASAQQDPGPSGIHTAYGDDPAHEMVVSWLAPPDADPRVEYGPDEELGASQSGEATPAATSLVVPYRATLGELEPNTTYHYRVVTADQASNVHTFTTAPPPGSNETTRITAFADHGTATDANRGDGDAPTRNTELAASLDPDLHLLAGDLSYAEGRAEQWNLYTEQIQPLAAEVPFMTVPGNHEREDHQGFHQYDARFPMPTPDSDDERWWAIQHGNVLIVGLNSERGCHVPEDRRDPGDDPAGSCQYATDPHEPQRSFFEDVLDDASGDPTVDWIVVFVHHPFWSSAQHGSAPGLQEGYMPLVDEHGVDVVIQGHDHVYERTELLRDGEPADEGTLYLTNGVGGSGFYSWEEDEPPGWSASRDNGTYGTIVLELSAQGLEGRFVSLEGETVDAFAFENVEENGLSESTDAGNGTDADTSDPGEDDRALPALGTVEVFALAVATAAVGIMRSRSGSSR